MKKLLMISLCTTGIMGEQFACYAKHFAQKYELYCVTNDNISKEETNAYSILNVRYKRKERLSYFSLSKLHKIKKYIKNINPDLIYVYSPHPVNIPLMRILKKYPLAFQVHDPIPHSGTSKLERIVLSMQLRRFYKYSDILFVAGEELKKQIINTNPKYSDKVYSICFGLIDDLKFKVEKSSTEYDLVFFGRIEYYKGIDVLLKAMECLPDLKCLIIGKGDINKACGLSNVKIPLNVKFINEYVPNEKLAKYISSSKVVVLPYRDATGSNTIAISNFYNKPVIATNVGVFPEYIGDGGIIVDPNSYEQLIDAIKKSLIEENYLRLINYAKENYNNKFDINVSVNKTVDVLNSILK